MTFQSPSARNLPTARLAADVKALRAAIGFDSEFASEYRLLRPYLPDLVRDWPEEMALQIMRVSSGWGNADDGEVTRFRTLCTQFTNGVTSGRFYEDFFSTMIALRDYFVERGVSLDILAGSLMARFQDAQLKLFFMTRAKDGRVFISALRCLFKIMALTLQILNRPATA